MKRTTEYTEYTEKDRKRNRQKNPPKRFGWFSCLNLYFVFCLFSVYSVYSVVSSFLKLALGLDARFGHRVLAVLVRHERGRRLQRELVHLRRELLLAVERVFVGHRAARVRRHAAHRRHQAGLDAALGL